MPRHIIFTRRFSLLLLRFFFAMLPLTLPIAGYAADYAADTLLACATR